MADDQNQRPYPSNEPPARGAPAATPGSASDPLAELARLIGQTDPFAEFGRENPRRAAAPPPAPDAPPPALNFGANEYFGAAPAAAAQQPAPPYNAPNRARQPYANSPYPAGADLYHTETEAPGIPAAQAGGYQQNQPHQAGDDEDGYDDVPPARRRVGIMAVAAVFALAVIGTAGAFGYRALFGSSAPSQPPPVIKADTAPSKIVPATANKTPNKLITDRIADQAQDEKLVSREERPVEMKDKPAGAALAPSQDNAQPASVQPAVLGSGVITSEPKKIRTIAIHPDQAGLGDSQPMAATAAAPPPPAPPQPTRIAAPAPVKQAAPPARAASNPPVEANAEPPPPPPPPAARQTEARAVTPARHTTATTGGNAPLSLSPDAPAALAARAPMRTAAVAAPTAPRAATPAAAASGSYAVQVSSQRSEADAQAAFLSLQAKYPNQLGGRQALIRKVELGEKGTYYRAMVGPFASSNDASALCSGLKAAGGQCLIQRN
jgi:hypothetical protein